MKWIQIIVLGFALCISIGCQSSAEIDFKAEKASIRAFLDEFWKSFEQKDMDKFSHLVAHDNGPVGIRLKTRSKGNSRHFLPLKSRPLQR